MASIDTWLDDQNLPLLNENEVIRELCRMGFDGANVTVHDGRKTNAGWQWNGFQLLPSDAPDNKVDPFGLRHT